jgi:hypothetical protein
MRNCDNKNTSDKYDMYRTVGYVDFDQFYKIKVVHVIVGK